MSAAMHVFRPVKLAADREALDPTALNDLRAIRDAFDRYERAFAQAAGRRVKHSYVRDRIMLLAVIEWARGNAPNIAFFQSACSHLSSAFGVRTELFLLKDLKLVLVRPHASSERAMEVVPTQKLVDFVQGELRLLGSSLSLAPSRGLH